MFILLFVTTNLFITAPPKPVGKTGLSSSAPSKARASASPLLFTPEQSGVAFSPYRNNNHKVHAQREDTSLTHFNKENASTPEKEMLSRLPPGTVQNKQGSNERFGNKHTDLESLLISLLMEKPQGMNIKVSIRPVPVFHLCGINCHKS